MPIVASKWFKVQNAVHMACEKSGRDLHEIHILPATKYATVEQINEIIDLGIDSIAENKLQDAQLKFPQLHDFKERRVKKYFIGHVQKNKVKKIVQLFDCIESVDSLDIALKINTEAEKLNKKTDILLEVNISRDLRKFGFFEENISVFLDACKFLGFLRLRGLMTIVPYNADLENIRPYFQKMYVLFQNCKKDFYHVYPNFDTLSMGMSHDFTVAIEEGTTEIRIGTQLFKSEL